MATKLRTVNSTKAAVMPNRTFSPNRTPTVFISATPEQHENSRSRTLPDHAPRSDRRGEVQQTGHSLVGYGSYGIAKRTGRRRRQICGHVGNIRIAGVMCRGAHHGVRIIGAAAITPGVQLRNEIGIFLLPDHGKHGRRSATVVAMA